MSQGLYVTGTDTGVGKTVASCALLHALRAQGRTAVGIKPVAITLAPTDPDVPCPGADSMRASGD